MANPASMLPSGRAVVGGVFVTLLGLAAWELFGRDLVAKIKNG